MSKYDVIIVGAGPAGIFTALELVKKNRLKVLILEKGSDIEQRECPAREDRCVRCRPCAITTGWGGAGAFSDGKLTLSTEIGGWLTEFVPEERLKKLITYVDELYQEFGAPRQGCQLDLKKVGSLKKRAKAAGLLLIPTCVKHLGTERCYEILRAMRGHLKDKVEIRTRTMVDEVVVDSGRVQGIITAGGEEIQSRYVVAAPGREGASWLKEQASRLGLSTQNNAVDIGVRIEVSANVVEPLTKVLYEPKLIYQSELFQDRVRLFCMNPYGHVSTEMYGEVITVNGHSYAGKKSANSNFALLVSTSFTRPFKEPIAYGKYIAQLANLLGEGIIVQRLGDLQKGRRSTEERIREGKVGPTLEDATPGDLSFVLPFRYLRDIEEMIKAMDKIAPGLDSPDTLLYGVEVKFYSLRLKLKRTLETEIPGLYTVGDGAGITRGLIQSSCAGVIAAQAILG